MRSTLVATVATFGLTLGTLTLSGGAMAQTTNNNMAPPPGRVPGTGLSEPASANASNIAPGDTRSPIAPRLPGSEADGTMTTPGQELRMAQRALDQHRTGAAQEALERAETRLLDRSTPPGMTNTPSMDRLALTIAQARDALGRNDLAGAKNLIAQALSQTNAG